MFTQNTPIKRFENNGKHYFTVAGIDYGAPLQILRETHYHIITYRKGHMAWAGLATQKYYNPSIFIFEKKDHELIVGFPALKDFEYTRETRKETLKEANEFFDKLIKKE